jgi:hypothetical protein
LQSEQYWCYEWAYLFGAVCAERGVGAALVLPHANAGAMALHLAEISRQVAPGAHAVLVCDGASWHKTSGRLHVPGNRSGRENSDRSLSGFSA